VATAAATLVAIGGGDSGDHDAEDDLAVDVRALRFRQVKGA
jgi:hypothetical protein